MAPFTISSKWLCKTLEYVFILHTFLHTQVLFDIFALSLIVYGILNSNRCKQRIRPLWNGPTLQILNAVDCERATKKEKVEKSKENNTEKFQNKTFPYIRQSKKKQE